jgi:tetratricopeptide (TPR) repeat protein
MWGVLRSLAALVLCAPLGAQEAIVARGFEHFYNLEYDEAIADFSEAVAQHPDLPGLYNHLAQAILYRAMFRAGALESELVTGNNPFLRRPKVEATPDEDRRFHQAVEKSMELCQALLNQDPRDTQALYALGVAYAWRANYNFLIRKAWRDALRDATTARKLHNRVTELDPSMIDARLMQGLHDFVVGYRGDKEQGIRTLELVAQKGATNRDDAKILLCAAYRREKRPQQAAPLVEELILRFPRNYLLYLELAQMRSELGDKVKALEALERLKALKESGAPGIARLPWERLWYADGNIQFWCNDLDAALDNMRRATAGAEALDLNTGVLAWMRLGQLYDLKGRRAAAQEAYRRAIAFAPASDAAAESKRYLGSPYRRAKR